MRKTIQIMIISAVILLIGYFGYRIYHAIKIKSRVAENIATLPQFQFITIQNQPYTKKNLIDTLGNVIIQLFSPDCEHCQYMANSFIKNKEKLKNIEIIMITPFSDSSSVALFAQTYRLNKLENVQLLLDKKGDFFKIFGNSIVPAFYIYKNNKLVKSIKGETKIENLLN